MRILDIHPGPKIGAALDVLLGEVLVDPKRNTKKFLEKQIKELGMLTEEKLKERAEKARKEREALEVKRDGMTKKKYWVI